MQICARDRQNNLQCMFSEKKDSHMDGIRIEQFDDFDVLYESITEEGSLGLLALGAMGLMLWRKKKAEINQQNKGEEAADG